MFTFLFGSVFVVMTVFGPTIPRGPIVERGCRAGGTMTCVDQIVEEEPVDEGGGR